MLSPGGHMSWRRALPVLLAILLLALTVRALTGYFIRTHFDDPGWFQFGSYSLVDRQAEDVLDGRVAPFWIYDPTRTDLMANPPGYSLWIALIYGVSGDRSPASVQTLHIVLDSLSVLLLVGIGCTAFSWRVGVAAGILGALSPLLALSGATPGADAPTSWLVLGGVWCMLLAAKREYVGYAVAAGALVGAACWLRVNPLFLVFVWAAVLGWLLKCSWRPKIVLSAAIAGSALIVISPVVIRNLTVFYPEFAPTGLNVGWNMLAGIGETERGGELDVPCCDAGIIEQDREAMGLPPDAPLGLNYPDGIRRDRERGRRAVAIMAEAPLWFAGVMAYRVAGHLKFAGAPAPNVGTAGFNVTPSKSLPPEWHGGAAAFGVMALGMIQSVLRHLALPLMIVGIVIGFRRYRFVTWLLISTVVYYLATLAIGHSEIRYGLPMQAILIVYAGLGITFLASVVRSRSVRAELGNE